MRGRKKSTKEANAEYLQNKEATEVAEQKKQQEQDLNQLLKVRREKLARSAGKRERSLQNRKI